MLLLYAAQWQGRKRHRNKLGTGATGSGSIHWLLKFPAVLVMGVAPLINETIAASATARDPGM